MFFRVKQPIKIGAKVFQTCVCYELTNTLRETVVQLVAEDKAELFEKEVFFANGRIVEKKKQKVEKAPVEEKEAHFDDVGTLVDEPLVKEQGKKGKTIKDF